MSTELKMVDLLPNGFMPQWPADAEKIAARIDAEEKDRWKVCGFIGTHMLLRRAKK